MCTFHIAQLIYTQYPTMTSSVLTNIFSEQKGLKNASVMVRVKKNRVYLFYIRVAAAATLMQVHKSFSCERPIEVSE